FRIVAVETIEQGIEILTGIRAGARDEAQGQYPEGSINDRVEKRLVAMAEKLKEFNAPARDEGEEAREERDTSGKRQGANGKQKAQKKKARKRKAGKEKLGKERSHERK